MSKRIKCPNCDHEYPSFISRTSVLLAEALKHVEKDDFESIEVIVGLIKNIEARQDDKQS